MKNHALLAASAFLFAIAPATHAQQPTGWIGNGHISAYTLGAGEFEISGGLSRVNDTIDFLDLREDLLAGNSRLVDNSGDLDGTIGEARVGIWKGLELFYRRDQQDMTLKVAPTSRANIIDLSEKLSTTRTEWGAKLVVYESSGFSAAIEATKLDSRSDDFGGLLEQARFGNILVTLDPPQYFSMDRLKDDGWLGRAIISLSLGDATDVSLWAGYGKSDASSGTSTQIDFDTIRNAFLQTFDIEEKQYRIGANLNLQQFERLPIQLGYEYIKINERNEVINSSNSTLIPSFLRGGNLANSATHNHTAYATASWWLTPYLYGSLTGKLFRNQFVGIMPHYNNPLSASFSETLYGFLEFKVGFKITR